MATGKNKSVKWMRMFLNEFNISGDALTFSGLENSFEEVDMTGWSNGVYTFLRDQVLKAGIRGFQAHLNDDTGGAFDELKDAAYHIASLLFGGAGEPAVGDTAYMVYAVQTQNPVSIDSKKAIIQADLLPSQGYDTQPFGVVLHPETSISITTTAASVDNGAATENGYQAHLHITTVSSGDYAITIEESSNGSDWSTLDTFTLDGSVIGSEILTGTGTVARYVRFVATRTAGTITPVCTFARR